MTDMEKQQLDAIVAQERVCISLEADWEEKKRLTKEAKEHLDESIENLRALARGGAQGKFQFEGDE